MLLIAPSIVFSQNRDYNWCFSDSCGIRFTDTSANLFPCVFSGAQVGPGSECAASISDENGVLLFYTNGVWLWDSSDQLMPQGTGLYSNVSTTQGALIVPKPDDSIEYYLFSLYAHPDYHGLYYSIVNMELNNGYGDIEPGIKNIRIDSSNVAEKLSAIRHANGRDWWVIHQEGVFIKLCH